MWERALGRNLNATKRPKEGDGKGAEGRFVAVLLRRGKFPRGLACCEWQRVGDAASIGVDLLHGWRPAGTK